MPAKGRSAIQYPGLLQRGDLRAAQRSHGHLRELGKVQDTIGMGIRRATHGHGIRVIPHDLQN